MPHNEGRRNDLSRWPICTPIRLAFLTLGVLAAVFVPISIHPRDNWGEALYEENMDSMPQPEACVTFTLRDFDRASKVLSFGVNCALSEQLRLCLERTEQPCTLQIATRGEVPGRYPQTFYGPNACVVEEMVNITLLTCSAGVAEERDVLLYGDVSRFPFDSYYTQLCASLTVPSEILSSDEVEEMGRHEKVGLAFYVYSNIQEYEMSCTAPSAGCLNIKVSRHPTEKARSILPFLWLVLVSFVFLSYCYRGEPTGPETWLGAAVLVIGIPAARVTLVPTDIHSMTFVDWLSLIPGFMLAIGITVSFAHHRKQGRAVEGDPSSGECTAKAMKSSPNHERGEGTELTKPQT